MPTDFRYMHWLIKYLIVLDDWHYLQACEKQRIDTVRLKLLKIAAKAIHLAKYITFKLCSSCPYKEEFYENYSNPFKSFNYYNT